MWRTRASSSPSSRPMKPTRRWPHCTNIRKEPLLPSWVRSCPNRTESLRYERRSAAAGSSTCSSAIRCPGSAERRFAMCLGIPGQVVEIVDAEQSLAKVDVNGVRRNISVRLLADDNLQVGDWVLVHVGFAMAKIDESEAAMTLDQVQKMGADYVNEIEAFNSSEIA